MEEATSRRSRAHRAVQVHRARQTPTSPDLKEWWISGERVEARTNRLILIVLAATSAIASALTVTKAVPFAMNPGPGTVRLSVAAVLWAGALILALAGMWRYGAAKADFMRRYQRQKVYRAIDHMTSDPELQKVMRLNQTRMDAYHELTLDQAAHAYRNTQFATTVGFLVLASGAILALAVHTTIAGQAVVGGLATIGTALSGYIVATFLKAQREALSQLTVYFRQPLTTSYILTAERLAMKLPTEVRHSTLAHLADQVVAHAFGTQDTDDERSYRHHLEPDLRREWVPGGRLTPSVTAELAAMATLLGQAAG